MVLFRVKYIFFKGFFFSLMSVVVSTLWVGLVGSVAGEAVFEWDSAGRGESAENPKLRH